MYSRIAPWASLALAPSLVSAACSAVSGSFTINLQNLYPENADWDPNTCKLYLSATYNSTLVIYDPYTGSSDVVSLPGISSKNQSSYVEYHLNGIDFDAVSGDVYICAGSANAFGPLEHQGDYSYANNSGPNQVVRYDPVAKKILATISTTDAQNTFKQQSGNETSGFQDMAENSAGDSFVIASFGNAIAKIPHGSKQASLWYAPTDYSEKYGFGGIFSLGDKLVLSDALSGGLVIFDSTASNPVPTYVPLQGLPSDYSPPTADGLLAPGKYNGTVALWSDDFNGTSVYGSHDNWASAHFLGLVPNNDPAAQGGIAVATFEIGQSIFCLTEFFATSLPPAAKSDWPVFDITAQVDEYVQRGGY